MIRQLCNIAVLSSLAFPPLAAAAEVIGTISAVLNGEPKTWHVLLPEGGPQGAAAWLSLDEHRQMFYVEGYEDRNVSFSMDESLGGMVADSKDNSIALSFAFPAGASSTDIAFPGTDENRAVLMMWTTIAGDTASPKRLTSTMRTGMMKVAEIKTRASDTAGFTGTFSGTIRSLGGGATGKLTDGKFEIEGIPFVRTPD